MAASVISMLLLLNGDTCGTSRSTGGRIVGGRNATEGEFPWQVSLQHKNSRDHICGGSIIKPDIVVTAAHCLDGEEAGNIVVLAGFLDLQNPPSYSQLRDVQGFAVHESFMMPKWPNDIALLKLTAPFDFAESQGHIGAVCLPAKDRPLEGIVDVSGWGSTSQGGPSPSHLLAVSVPVISPTDCTLEIPSPYDSKIMFCTKSPGKGTCHGDSGGPAVLKESDTSILVGVVSGGIICGVTPSIFTKVPVYIDWISENIAKLQ